MRQFKYKMSFANLFTFSNAYPYNSESFAYVNCILLKTINESLPSGTQIPEAIVNFKTSKLKLNVNGFIFTIPFNLGWIDEEITRKDDKSNDSDFDHDEEDSDDEDDDSDDDEDEEEEA